jgi:hypothetical protein
VPVFPVLLVNTVVAILLVVVAIWKALRPSLHRRWAIVAALPLLAAGLLIAFVFSEDTYRDNGISRWDAYRSPGGSLGPMFVLSIALMAVAAGLLAYAGLTARARLLRATAGGAGLVAFFLLGATIIGFGVN